MKGYLFKDFYLNYGTLIVIAAIQLVSSAICIVFASLSEDNSFLPFVCLICSFMVFVIAHVSSHILFKNDERPSWIAFSASTPQTYKCQVGAKYIYQFAVNVMVLLFGFATYAVCSEIISESMELWGVLLLFSWYIILNAIKFPFIIRFGSDVGERGDIAIISVIVMVVVVYFLFGDISFVNLEDPFGSIIEFFNNDGLKKLTIVLLCTALPLYLISYLVSLLLYKKGIENND